MMKKRMRKIERVKDEDFRDNWKKSQNFWKKCEEKKKKQIIKMEKYKYDKLKKLSMWNFKYL